MQQFASVALFRRNGQMTFRAPIRRSYENLTQARKSAARVWNGSIRSPDKINRVIVVCPGAKGLHVSERAINGAFSDWTEQVMSPAEAVRQPHLSACMEALGIDPSQAAPPMPDVLEINGVIYRREI